MKTLLVFTVCAGGILANTSNCPLGSTMGNSGAPGVAVPSSASGSDTSITLAGINATSTGFTSGVTAGGCFNIDQSFSNLAISNGGGTTGYASVSSGTAAQAITFSSQASVAGNINFDTTDNFSTAGSGNIASGSAVQFVDYSDFGTGSAPSSVPGLAKIDVTISGINFTGTGAGNSIVVTEVGCFNLATGAGSAATFTTCATGTTLGGTSSVTITSANVTSGSFSFAVFTLPSNLRSIDTDFSDQLNENGGVTSFETFGESFDTTSPEPSTFVLISTALGGLGLLRVWVRRRKA